MSAASLSLFILWLSASIKASLCTPGGLKGGGLSALRSVIKLLSVFVVSDCIWWCSHASSPMYFLSCSLSHTHTHPHSEMLGGPSVLWASSSSSSSVVFMPTGSMLPDCVRVCPQASELGPGPGSCPGPEPELLVWGMVYTLEESADIQYLAPRAKGLPEWCEPLTRQQKIKNNVTQKWP